jgi:membrane associated rhomboid family serine protease
MILPLSDAPNPRGTPIVTWTLILLNVAVYLMVTLPLGARGPDPSDPVLGQYVSVLRDLAPPGVSMRAVLGGVSAYDLFVFKHGFRPAAPELAALLTSLFLHGGFLHLLGNMLFLWIYGDNVEYRLGRWGYLGCYLLTGVAATLFYALFAAGSQLPLVGASGAISGVLGFYFLWFPRNKVRLFVFFFPIFVNVIEVSARIVLGFYLVVDNLLPFLLAGERQGGGVAHGAHLGGFVAGLAIAWVIDRRQVSARPGEYRVPPVIPSTTPAEAIRRAVVAGDFETAARLYFTLDPTATRGVLRAEDSLALADWLAANRQGHAALGIYRRHLRDYPLGPGAAEAHLGAGIVQLDLLGQVAPAYQHFLDAIELAPGTAVADRARVGLAAIAERQKYPWRRPPV